MKLPATITRRWAAAAAAEALGKDALAARLFEVGDPMMLEDHSELAALQTVLRSTPEWGGPGVNFDAPLVSNERLATWQAPAILAFETEQSPLCVYQTGDVACGSNSPVYGSGMDSSTCSDSCSCGSPTGVSDSSTAARVWGATTTGAGCTGPLRHARPADHEGALLDDQGLPLGEPRGAILYWLAIFAALSMQTMNSGTSPPLRRPRGRSRPSPLDIRGTLRILVGLVGRCRPKDVSVSPATCVALLLWLHGHCRPKRQRPPDRPWPFVEQPNRFALRKSNSDYQDDDLLPTVKEVEPWVVTGASIRRLAKAIDDRARGRRGAYQP